MSRRGIARRLLRIGAVPLALGCVLAGLTEPPASAAAVCQGWTGAEPDAGVQLDSVAIVSACDVWAVSTNGGVIAHWTGGASWTTFDSPGLVMSIAAVSASDVWAVGQTDPGAALIMHWNGTSWAQVPGADLGTGQVELTSVSASSASDVWAVGSLATSTGGHAIFEHWDGSAWRQISAPDPGSAGQPVLSAVTTVSPALAWAVGDIGAGPQSQQVIERWNGTAWSRVPAPHLGTAVVLSSVSAVSAGNAWVTGYSYGSDGFFHALIEHWDGTHWTSATTPDLGPDRGDALSVVHALSADNVWAAGYFVNSAHESHSLIEHWDGSGWTLETSMIQGLAAVTSVGAGPDGTTWLAGSDARFAAVAEPVTGAVQAELAVNMLGRNLRETGLVSGPAGNLSVANGTSPAVAAAASGDFKTAWTAANSHLWTVDSAGHRTDTMRLVAAGSGPGIAALAGGGFEVAYPSAADGSMWLMAPDGTFSQATGQVTIAAGTSPSITALPGGGFEVAVHAAGTDHLITVGPGTSVRDTGVVLAPGTSPAVAGLIGGGTEIAVHAAGSDQLVAVGPSGVARGTGLTLAAGTSPAIATAAGVEFVIVAHVAGTDHLAGVGPDLSTEDLEVRLAAGSSPALTVMPAGGALVAYAAAGSGDLSTLTQFNPERAIDTGIPMSAGTSPAIASKAPVPPTLVTVPDVLSMDQDSAEDTLAAHGLSLGAIARDTRCIDVAGTVLLQDPIGHARVPPGTAVHLTVSTGTDASGQPCVFQ